MADHPILIKRYPNRRYYASHTSTYVSLKDIEQMVISGHTVEIRDSQSGEDMTQSVLIQIIMERHPDKISLFPSEMLHFVLRSNDLMSGLLGDYFRHSLDYLDYLRRQNPAAASLAPMQWIKGWLDNVSTSPKPDPQQSASSESAQLSQRVKQLEERIEQLEAGDD
ncbi:PHB/PHA accumulation regulator DNA-binding domain protein [Stieleria maiorica]|uniref:PHB/PHA accumulation regulator DNA-binding domain protein n=1 Tax=Stieleria maiorica TaxID=2795974 RepID=A0A5B9MHJ9_9BACT|nr:polyhydroxyalkanoate synthesis regulator DNA-binding domain-containing protein [Stieleria maiorica]QEG00762.1 PHB/PHA accumulation regulator DNA-binding domain protein [Stieleria maiorica]